MMSFFIRTIAERRALLYVQCVFIALCLGLGGSSRYALHAHSVLQIIAAVGTAILVLTWPRDLSIGHLKIPICALFLMEFVGVLQSIPLPQSFWEALPGRDAILDGHNSLGIVDASLPLSLDAESTVDNFGYALIPLFVILLSARIGLRTLHRNIPAFLCVLAAVSATLGLFQVYAGRDSALYFYENTSFGFPVGTFSNVNHFACFLLMLIPCGIFLLREASIRKFNADERIAASALFISLLFVSLIGITAAGSLAIYLLSAPVVVIALMVTNFQKVTAPGSSLAFLIFCSISVLGITLVYTSPVFDGLGLTGSSEHPTSRQNIWSYTISAIDAYWPVGSGAGTYQSVIPLFENPDTVTSRYIALAHNEYLQIVMEFGVIGLAVILLMLGWLSLRAREILMSRDGSSSLIVQRIALIGILVCVLHSVVDYPARTPAIASILGLLVSIVAFPRRSTALSDEVAQGNEKRLVL